MELFEKNRRRIQSLTCTLSVTAKLRQISCIEKKMVNMDEVLKLKQGQVTFAAKIALHIQTGIRGLTKDQIRT